ncbi:hypothetical protein NOI20_09625 [Rhodobacteraceae bacterium 10Alg 79]|uniref:Uncharacterized protein n=2 Tax=Rhodalgimonas zhirmunskyi TaxID=2964767 RepID=A0AAJ1U6G7_9RHOB|nr:hypothetical protein [Rhodoalgimonas zhirmunskyi]
MYDLGPDEMIKEMRFAVTKRAKALNHPAKPSDTATESRDAPRKPVREKSEAASPTVSAYLAQMEASDSFVFI